LKAAFVTGIEKVEIKEIDKPVISDAVPIFICSGELIHFVMRLLSWGMKSQGMWWK